MAKKSKSSNSKKKTIQETNSKIETKRKKINKYVFFGSWILWALIMIPFYIPNKCAAFFEPVLHATFTCPPISLIISIILGSLFMAFLTWIVCWVATWLKYYHQEVTWDNFKQWLKE